VNEKIEIAKQLSRLGVDVLEAGFPVASQGDFDAVKKIANEVGHLMVGREAIGKPIVSAQLVLTDDGARKSGERAVDKSLGCDWTAR